MNLGQITPGYHHLFTLIFQFWEEKVVKINEKKLLLAINGRSPNFKVFFSLMLDKNFMNPGQIAHKLWLLSLFYPIYHFWG